MSLKRLTLLAVLAVAALLVPHTLAQGAPQGPVLVTELTGVIGPPATHHVAAAIDEAAARNAELLILQINTPGGLETSTRDIIEEILASPTPVVGYVSPSGGRAASAGTFILYATHVAAMASGTNVGAATPVQITSPIDPGGAAPAPGEPGEERGTNSDALDRKAVNDSAAFIRSLAGLRGRNAEWAERAVRQGEAVSAAEALELGAIEIVAEDMRALLAQLDGRRVTTSAGERMLSTSGAVVERIEPGWITQILALLANPNIAFLLMLIGVYGLIFEFANPGAVAPGVIGAIALILGLYALNQLPLNYAGLTLLVLGIVFLIAEVFTPSFGILGLGGIVAFIIGGAMLVDTNIPELRLSWGVIITSAFLTGGFVLLAVGASVQAHRRRVATGREGLLGDQAEVLDWSGAAGHVRAASERWSAVGPEGLSPGSRVRIVQIDGLTLHVTDEPLKGED
jgi:membrane-bound serine protease (ClpP class)